jgi:biopolymer transport protein ExbD/biopolymer transport protein TolR
MGIAESSRQASHNVNSTINVTPMVDVMLVLLIIFMVITPMLMNKVAVNLAKVDNPAPMPDANKTNAIVIAVTRDGKFFLGQNLVAPNDLGTQVSERLQDRTNKTVYIRADARAQYKAVEDAIDDIRPAGVQEVGLLTQRLSTNVMTGE